MLKSDLNNNSLEFPLTRSLNLTSLEMSASYHDKGVALYYLGSNQDALRNFDRVLQQNPNDADALTYKINILLRMNRHGEAPDLCDSILNKEPESIFALGGKVCALAALGEKMKQMNFTIKLINYP